MTPPRRAVPVRGNSDPGNAARQRAALAAMSECQRMCGLSVQDVDRVQADLRARARARFQRCAHALRSARLRYEPAGLTAWLVCDECEEWLAVLAGATEVARLEERMSAVASRAAA